MTADPATDAVYCLVIIETALIALLGLGVIAYLFPAACRRLTDRLERIAGITNHAE